MESIGIPTYLSGMARGLLGSFSPIQYRHNRGVAIKEADLIVLCGVPFDFRLGYGRGVPSATPIISVNRNSKELVKNRKPTAAIKADAGDFLIRIAKALEGKSHARGFGEWHNRLRGREEKRDREISEMAKSKSTSEDPRFLNPLHLVTRIEESVCREKGVFVADGGDFVATASYVVRPRGVCMCACVVLRSEKRGMRQRGMKDAKRGDDLRTRWLLIGQTGISHFGLFLLQGHWGGSILGPSAPW